MNKHVRRQMGLLLGEPLAPSEIQTIVAIMRGNTHRRQLAAELGTTEAGVGMRMSNIYAKTGGNCMADIVLMAIGIKESAVDFRQYLKDLHP